jgi:hypothetical protein
MDLSAIHHDIAWRHLILMDDAVERQAMVLVCMLQEGSIPGRVRSIILDERSQVQNFPAENATIHEWQLH